MGRSEIDTEATTVKLKGATDNDYLMLNLTRTGSTWWNDIPPPKNMGG